MSQHNITVEGGTSVQLPIAGKYCKKDIIITATGSGGGAVDVYDPTQNPIEQGNIQSASGADFASTTRLRVAGYIKTRPNTAYKISTNLYKMFVIQCYADKTPIKNSGWQASPYLFNTDESCEYIRLTFQNSSGSTITADEFEWLKIVQLEGGSASETDEIEDAFIERTMSGEYVNDRVTSIGYGCFQGAKSLTSVSFPEVTSVKDYAFSDCTALTTVNMPLLKSVSARAFASTKLSNIDFPLLSSIGTYTFSYISVPNTARLPSLATVPNSGFRDNKGITMVDLATATKIDTLAFYFCSALESLILRSNTVATLSNTGAFTGTKIANGTGYIYVPSALVEEYKVATNWSTYANQIRAIEDYPDICG